MDKIKLLTTLLIFLFLLSAAFGISVGIFNTQYGFYTFGVLLFISSLVCLIGLFSKEI